jgi:hypothetical protein
VDKPMQVIGSEVFNVGDVVISKHFGVGEVTNIKDKYCKYPVQIKFESMRFLRDFTLEGKFDTGINSNNEYAIIKIEETMKQVTRSEVFSEFARVSKMIEGIDLLLREVYKLDGKLPMHDKPLIRYNTSKYTFALALVEGKPVFAGDKLWSKYFKKLVTIKGMSVEPLLLAIDMAEELGTSYEYAKDLTWNQPKKTFMLNGEELPLPDNTTVNIRFTARFCSELMEFSWNSTSGRDKVQKAILKLLNNE